MQADLHMQPSSPSSGEAGVDLLRLLSGLSGQKAVAALLS